jgi:hypothetical protein
VLDPEAFGKEIVVLDDPLSCVGSKGYLCRSEIVLFIVPCETHVVRDAMKKAVVQGYGSNDSSN